MADRSFKEYIGRRFYDQFFNAIKSYVIQNRHNIELRSRSVSSVDYAELSDFEIISVGIDDRDEMGIAFDYVVVPVGKDNHHSIAEVVKMKYFAEEAVPLPLEKTKHIIRKCTDDDFDPS